MNAPKRKIIEKRHASALRNVSICQLESFLGIQLGKTFSDGTNGQSGPVIYSIYREKPIDPFRDTSPTPDLTVVYINGGWRLTFVELKSSVSEYTSDSVCDQKHRSMEFLKERRYVRNFIQSLGDKRLTPANADQMFDAGITHHLAHVTKNGSLSPLPYGA